MSRSAPSLTDTEAAANGSVSEPNLGESSPNTDNKSVGQTQAQPDTHGGHPRLRHFSLRARAGIAAAVIAGVLVTIFAAQNGGGVRVVLLAWTINRPPLFVVCLVCVGVGIALGIAFSVLRWPRSWPAAATRTEPSKP